MKRILQGSRNLYFLLVLPLLFMASCDDDKDKDPIPTGMATTYPLASVSNPAISGTANIIENDDQSVTIELKLSGTKAGGSHPAHIHMNTAAESGDIVVSLSPVDGATGISRTTTSKFDNGKALSYKDLLAYDGYINVHASSTDLKTLVAQGDIGQNVLTTESKVYQLGSVVKPSIKGTATFTKRQNGEALAVIKLENTVAGDMHPGHIHINTAAESGAIAISFAPVDGATGISKTNIAKKDDGTAFKYDDIANFNGYINIHQSATDLGTLIAQGDIGQNELTGTTKVYNLGAVDFAGVTGTATFAERKNGTALATVVLTNSPAGGVHPGHIHSNSAAQSGGIIFTFNPVTKGVSKTQVAKLDNGADFKYANIETVDGYINFHESATNLAKLVAQGDIGVNELTGKTKVYKLGAVDFAGVTGTATFAERKNGTALATVVLMNSPAGGVHPGHIHANTAAQSGGIIFTFKPTVNGVSKTQVAKLDNGTDFKYADVLTVNGYINFHESATNLGKLVAQGDIGVNELTGNTKSYALGTKDVPGVSGTALFSERANGTALITLTLKGTTAGGMHPAHIHMNDAATSGPIVISLANVSGDTGVSKTQVATFDDKKAVTYTSLLGYNGYINVHASMADLKTLLAQGNIGSNVK